MEALLLIFGKVVSLVKRWLLFFAHTDPTKRHVGTAEVIVRFLRIQ